MRVEACFPRESCQGAGSPPLPQSRGHCSAEGRAQPFDGPRFRGLLGVCHVQMGRGLGPAPPESLGTQHQRSGEARKEVGVLVDQRSGGWGTVDRAVPRPLCPGLGSLCCEGLREGRCWVCPIPH